MHVQQKLSLTTPEFIFTRIWNHTFFGKKEPSICRYQIRIKYDLNDRFLFVKFSFEGIIMKETSSIVPKCLVFCWDSIFYFTVL